MDALVTIAALAYSWRFTICCALAASLCVALVGAFPSLHAVWLIYLAATGAAVGILWQGRHMNGMSSLDEAPEPAISKPVAALALPFFGLIVVSIIANLSDSLIAAVCGNFVLVILYFAWAKLGKGRDIRIQDILFVVFFMAVIPALIAGTIANNL